jgi:hypothetical protein
MGLFDTVICDYPLPLPEFTEEDLEDINAGEEGNIDWNEVEWQTKDMGNMLDVYSIEDDGQIYLRPTDWLQNEGSVSAEEGELEKFEKTAEIIFYNIILGKEYDHWIEFKALVWKGELKELDLVEHKKDDNSDRIEMQNAIKEQVNKVKSKGKIYRAYRYVALKPLEIVRLIMSLIIGLTIRVERWLP